jgi:hypothetical protein
MKKKKGKMRKRGTLVFAFIKNRFDICKLLDALMKNVELMCIKTM